VPSSASSRPGAALAARGQRYVAAFWPQLAKLRELGASGIVALQPDALRPA